MLSIKRAFSSTPHSKMLGQHNRIKRFYKQVNIIEHPREEDYSHMVLGPNEQVGLENMSKRCSDGKFYAVALDERVLKTLYKDDMLLPSYGLAVAIADEWEA